MRKLTASKIIDMLGGTAAVAALVGVKGPSVSEWRRGEIPSDRLAVLAVELERRAVNGGRRYTCEEVCPAVRWHRIADKAWPWHPRGRPVVDLTRIAASDEARG